MKQELDVTAAAKVMSKLGASKGGLARKAALAPEKRSEIARQAVMTRWAKRQEKDGSEKIPRATHGSPDRLLRIGMIEIPCYVLDDGRRVIAHNGMITALGVSRGGIPQPDDSKGYRISSFVAGKRIQSFISNTLAEGISNPIVFRTPRGSTAYGYEATILADLCEAVLEARKQGALENRQLHIAERCENFVRGFARVGIIALVDEATGYQAERDRDALHKILEAYIAKELLPWTQRFPNEFYQQMFRLQGWQYSPLSTKHPRRVAQLTVRIVYEKLPPGVLDELRRKNPVVKDGRRRHKLFQFVTEDIGNPHLERHLASVTTLMRISPDQKTFDKLLEKAFPTPNKPVQEEMKLDVEPSNDVIDVEVFTNAEE